MEDLFSSGKESAETGTIIDLPGLIAESIAVLSDHGEDFGAAVQFLQQLEERLAEGRFHLAVLGQFKRGKSTLLNALLGDDLLPTDILPVTAIPTFILAGSEVTATVHFADGSDPVHSASTSSQVLHQFLNDYVTEAGNPHNRRHVSRVEIYHPAPLLRQGVVLIDTPGIGSTFKHNTAVAHQVLPQCDAALFLVSPDPPITESELDYLQQIMQRMPRTFYLLNKVDFLDAEERTVSLRFLADQLSQFYDAVPQVLPISARKGLKARLAGDQVGWQNSGMELVEQNLIDFLAREKQQTLHQVVEQRCREVLDDAMMQLRLSLTALKLPEEELQKRLEQFRKFLPMIEREQQASVDVLDGDLKRAVERLAEEVEAVRRAARKQILDRIESVLVTATDPELLERQAHEIIAAEIGQFFAPAMREVTAAVHQEACALLEISQQRSNQLIAQVRQTAAELFDIPYRAPAAGSSYVQLEAPAWSDDLFISDMDPLGQKLSRKLLSKKYRLKRTVNRMREESRKLVNQNIEQISWTLRQSLDETFRRFAAELREQLQNSISATRKAMEIALQRSETQSRDTADTEDRLQRSLRKLQDLRQMLNEQ